MKIALIGCGVYSMGIAALLNQQKGNDIWMWVHDQKIIPTLEKENKDLKITYQADYQSVVKDACCLFILTSSPFFKDTINNLKPLLNDNVPIFIGTKGLLEDNMLLTTYAKERLKSEEVYFMAGPTLAKDIRTGKYAAFSLSKDNILFQKIMPKTVDIDIVNDEELIQLCSLYKNVIAIASGMVSKLSNSYSTTISFLTKALKEFADKLHVDVLSYAAIGDFYLTGTVKDSRNYTYGTYLAKDLESAKTFLKNNTVEGALMLPLFYNYLHQKKQPIVIIDLLYNIIYNDVQPSEILKYLTRD